MVIFLNGLPLITIELKNPFTGQNVYDAMRQYKRDRDGGEAIFTRCVVHFGLDSDEIFMSTKLEGKKTRFLPFNLGLNNGSGEMGLACDAGNPVRDGEVKTSYLWKEILQKETLLNLLFTFTQIVKKDRQEFIIFPRFHQFDVVRKLLTDAKENGVGKRYLIQHSAGSGKSNSIAWLAHNLVSLHKMENEIEKNVFDSILVVTDRKVLDRQIQENVKSFSEDKNLVESITQGSKQLKTAIEESKKIIITTIQKFPYIASEITHLKDKTFVIIIDEAHSSQSGQNAQKMAETISNKNTKELKSSQIDSGEIDIEEELIKIIENKKFQQNASYFAFTATPKPKTLEMFGTPCEIDGVKKFIPFHLYSMKQAIEEGFILDVLKGYTTYKSYYKIISSIDNDFKEYEKKRANAKLKAYVTNHIEGIQKKARIMIEHFFQNSSKKIDAKAKAMVVTSSRENAIKYYLFFKNYLQENYPQYKALVAFSGDKEIDGESYSEAMLNGFSESLLKDEFKKDCYRFLIVADKYQTGFDEPLLHTMYVDKLLEGVSAVQTLSRLNRICQNKENTCVIDFANTHEEIGESFSTFYEETYLKDPTDYEKIFTLKNHLFEYEIFTQDELDSFVKAILEKEREDSIHSKLDSIARKYNAKSDDEKTEFYTKAKTYLRDYSFLAQILPFNDTELEKLYNLLKMLITKITPPRQEDLARGILDNVDLNSIRVQLVGTQDINISGNGELSPSKADGSSKTKENEYERLSNIVKEFNDRFGSVEFGTDDEITKALLNLKNDIAKEPKIKDSLADRQNANLIFQDIFKDKYLDFYLANSLFFAQLENGERFKERISNAIFEMICEYA